MSVRGALTLTLALLAATLVHSTENAEGEAVPGSLDLHEEQSGAACEYGGRWYGAGNTVPTQEPCLVCTCTKASLVCHLRMCPAVPTSVPKGCYKLQKAGTCCPEVVCDGELESNKLYTEEAVAGLAKAELRRQHVEIQSALEDAVAAVEGTRRRWNERNNYTTSTTTTTTTSSPQTHIPNFQGCVEDGAVFAEGSAMISPDECFYCFCIHGQRQCVAPKCLLPVEGCRPRYRTFSCCPSFYDCYGSSTITTTNTTTTTIAPVAHPTAPPAAPLADVPAPKTLTEEDEALTLSAPNQQSPVEALREEFERRTGRVLNIEEEVDLNNGNEEQESAPDAAPEEVEESTEPPIDVEVETEPTGPTSTRKPPTRLRPMSRPSLAEIAKRRQESRFKARDRLPSPPSSPRIRISRPSRPQSRERPTQSNSPALSFRYRTREHSRYGVSTATTFTTVTPELASTTATPEPSSTTAIPEASSNTTTTTTTTITTTTAAPEDPLELHFKPKRPTKLQRFTREPSSTSTTTAATPTVTTTQGNFRVTSFFATTPTTTREPDDAFPTRTTEAPKRPVKDNKLRWNKFRFHSTISSASNRPTRFERRPPTGFTTATTSTAPEEAPSEVYHRRD